MASPLYGETAPEWADMSNHVVHFTKAYEGKSAYSNMLSILCRRIIEARNAYGLARKTAPDVSSQQVVCFSEIPLHQIRRLAKARSSKHGIVFKKDYVVHLSANPILYAYKDGDAKKAIDKLIYLAGTDKNHPIWKLTPYVDAPGKYGDSTYFFEWEREWRKVGDFKFIHDFVAFLIIPEKEHEKATVFFQNAKIEDTGPSYECPFIDAYWDQSKIDPLLASLP